MSNTAIDTLELSELQAVQKPLADFLANITDNPSMVNITAQLAALDATIVAAQSSIATSLLGSFANIINAQVTKAIAAKKAALSAPAAG